MLICDFKQEIKCNKPVRAPTGSKKKYRVKVCRNGKEKTIGFGYRGMQDYTQHKNSKRKKNYLARSGGIRNKSGKLTKNDPFSSNYWSRKFLWGRKKKSTSIKH